MMMLWHGIEKRIHKDLEEGNDKANANKECESMS